MSHFSRLTLAAIVAASSVLAASADNQANKSVNQSNPGFIATARAHNVFNHLEGGVSIGSTGIGLNIATSLTDHMRVRAGVDFTPHFNVPMSFSLQSYTDGGGINTGNFDKMQPYMKKLTGYEVDDRVELDGKPTMTNFKLLFDVYPWADKGWRVTAGFYLGSRRVAKAINTMGEMPSLLAVNIYNHFYDFIMSDDAIDKPIFGDVYLDPFLIDDVREDLADEGYMGIHVGDYKDGRPYMMQPDADGMVKVNAFVNRFKPYAGLGYTGEVGKDRRWKLDVDCGVMMWGGTPSLMTHDGTNLSKDIVNIKGKPGDYVDIMKTFKVYPVISFSVSYRFF